MTDKEKLEMYEKEAGLIIKQMALYGTIWGTTFVFVLKSFNLTLPDIMINDVSFSSRARETIALAAMGLLGWAFSEFLLWIAKSVKRIAELREKIERLNNDLG